VETDGLCDDPGAVSKVAIRDTEPKLHRIIDWCRHKKALVVEFRKPRFTRKRNRADHHSTRERPSHVSDPEFDRISRTP
jgi:hypothetical protein